MIGDIIEQIVSIAVLYAENVPSSCKSLLTLLLLEDSEGLAHEIESKLDHREGDCFYDQLQSIIESVRDEIENNLEKVLEVAIHAKDECNQKYYAMIAHEWKAARAREEGRFKELIQKSLVGVGLVERIEDPLATQQDELASELREAKKTLAELPHEDTK
jgi:hypothetical protein